MERPGYPRPRPMGPKEPNGPRWKAACALERARQKQGQKCDCDPLTESNPLDSSKKEWRQFIQFPAKRNFVSWTDFRVRVDGKRSGPLWQDRTAVTYYSTWQLLLFLECHDMGTRFFGNTENWDWRSGQIPESWAGGGIQFEPIRSLQSFRKFERVLDAIAWFAEERAKNDHYVLTRSGWRGRRPIDDQEHAEMETRSVKLARRCRTRFRASYPQVIEVIRFLCERWGDWECIGYQNHKKAYQTFISKSVTLARYLKDVPPKQLFEDVGRVTGHFKPTLRVIFQDWATEWREDAERLIISFSRPDAILKADFTKEQANAFLDFVEGHDLYEFYWRSPSVCFTKSTKAETVSVVSADGSSPSGSAIRLRSARPWVTDLNGFPSKSRPEVTQKLSTWSVNSSTSTPRARKPSNCGEEASRSRSVPTA